MKPNCIFPGILLFVHLSASAQTLNYQGIARNAEGEPLANRTLALRLSIKDTPDNGDMLYTETKSVATNGFGLYTIAINDGNGTRTGNFAEIDWSQQRFIQTEIDPDNGTAFTNLGTAPLHSVPQALNAIQAATLKGIPEPKEGYFIEYQNGKWVQKPKPKKYYAIGAGLNPVYSWSFVGPTCNIIIAEDNPKVSLSVHKAFGSNQANGGIGLSLALGYRKVENGVLVGEIQFFPHFQHPDYTVVSVNGIRVPNGTRTPMSLAGTFSTDFRAGEEYVVGMVAQSINFAHTWNDNGSGMSYVEVSY